MVDTERLGTAGRRVRCASCRETWSVGAGAATLIEPPPHSPPSKIEIADAAPVATVLIEGRDEGAPVVRLDTSPRPSERSERTRRGFAFGRSSASPARTAPAERRYARAIVMVLLLSVTSVIAFRPGVVRIVPESGSLFGMIGLPVNLVGLTLRDVGSGLLQEAGGPVLVVEGQISNVVGRDVGLPKLELKIEGERGTPLYNWSVPAGRATLGAGETMRFQARLASPPPAGRRVLVTFQTGTRPDAVASR